jgi:hypothetical protein
MSDGPSGRAAAVSQIRGALAHLHDHARLETDPLAARFGGGRALRRELLDAIAALKPTRAASTDGRAGRPHELLRLRYLEALPVDDVQKRLLIGRASTTASTSGRSPPWPPFWSRVSGRAIARPPTRSPCRRRACRRS